MTDRPQKITFAEMREMGVRGLLIYCADYRCSHSIAISGDAWRPEIGRTWGPPLQTVAKKLAGRRLAWLVQSWSAALVSALHHFGPSPDQAHCRGGPLRDAPTGP
jgi:hypothetical protein